jgi:hypothetical protein
MTDKAVRATITIAGISVEVFQLPSGEYVMSQTQVVKAIEAPKTSIIRFLESSEAKAVPSKASELSTLHVEGSVKPINVVPTDAVRAFWMEQVVKGNAKAFALVSACMQETLERRCDNVFGVTKSEQQYEQQAANWLEKWQQTRRYLAEQHIGFCRACHDYGFPPAKTHDKLAMAACGMQARELKKLEKVCGDKDIGLNHIKDIDILMKFAKAKLYFSSFRKGDVDNRIGRALDKIRKEEKTLKVTTNN